MQQAVLEARERLLGAGPPDTITSKNNLAYTMWQLQEYVAAFTLMKQASDGFQITLAPEHPNTISALQTLAIMQKQLDNLI